MPKDFMSVPFSLSLSCYFEVDHLSHLFVLVESIDLWIYVRLLQLISWA
jgi:hypothetical protein